MKRIFLGTEDVRKSGLNMSHLEIELKLSVLPEAIKRLREKIISFHYTHFSLHQLSNIYFETVDHQLRRWDMGLRIRGCDGRYEMTIKTAGKVIGGLHQRHECNTCMRIGIQRRCTVLLPDVQPRTFYRTRELRENPFVHQVIQKESQFGPVRVQRRSFVKTDRLLPISDDSHCIRPPQPFGGGNPCHPIRLSVEFRQSVFFTYQRCRNPACKTYFPVEKL